MRKKIMGNKKNTTALRNNLKQSVTKLSTGSDGSA
jgi:hypothetical protein